MRAVITGGGGQLGRALLVAKPSGITATSLGRREFDLTDPSSVRERLLVAPPDVIINTAAYTAVDRAESEPDLAMQVNRDGAGTLATVAAEIGSRLVHVSTDFVFDGNSTTPYSPDAPPRPLGVYGRSKLEGERLVLETLGPRAAVVRTAWLYGSRGRNFVNTMLRLMDEGREVSVVADQIGTPTWTLDLARALWAIAGRDDVSGIQHWTNLGVASWYDFAVAIKEEAQALGRWDRPPVVRPIFTEDYPTPAFRPRFSVLDTRSTRDLIDVASEHWRESLRRMLGGEPDG